MKSRLEFRVGLFVFVGLALVAVLLIQFSKGMNFFRPTYAIYLQSDDVGSLREKAAVLMSGVHIGSVSKIELAPDGKAVSIRLKIDRGFPVYRDARFIIEQSGFLGDQYVAIQPTRNSGGLFQDGDRAKTEAPFNLQQAARSASGLIQRLDETAANLSSAITEIHKLLLNQETLTNLSVTVANLRQMSERALAAVERVDALVATNSPYLSESGSNLVAFSQQLQTAGGRINDLLSTNSPEVTSAVKNFESSSATLNELMSDVKAGKGLAGTVLRDEKVAEDLATLTRNLAIASSNLNRLGLWGILWKRKEPKERDSTPAERLQTPKAGAE